MQWHRLSSLGWRNLQRKIVIGFSLVSAISIGVSWITYRTVVEAEEAKTQVFHTYEVLRMLETVVSDLKDVETGQQGYMINGQEIFLEPYYAGLKAIPQDIKTLRQLTQDNQIQQQRLDRLESLAMKKVAIAKMRVETRRSHGFEASKGVDVFGSGNEIMEDIRWLSQQMQHTEMQLLRQRSQLADSNRKMANRISLVGLGLDLILLLSLSYQISQEMTIRQQAEKALQGEQEFLRALLNNLKAGVVACDSRGILTLSNQMVRELHGLPEQPLPPEEWAQYYDLYLSDGKTLMDKKDVPLYRALQGEFVQNVEVIIRPKQGTTRVLSASGQAIFGAQGEKLGAVVALHDVTQLRQTEAELQAYAVKLEKVNQELEQFNYIVAHDLKTPLRTIASRIEILGKHSVSPKPEIQHQMGRISLAAQQMDQLLSDLLTYSQVGIETKLPVLTDCNAIIQQVLNSLLGLIQASHASIEVESQLPTVLVEPFLLAQVFQHLISNSLKFCQGPPQVIISATCSQQSCTFCVADNGIGIPSGLEKRIFQLFKRLHTQAEYEGTGMGLAIVKRIITWHQGQVWVESELGKGSKFFFTLPTANMARETVG